MTDTPNIQDAHFHHIDDDRLFSTDQPQHPVRILLLYGSLRDRSFRGHGLVLARAPRGDDRYHESAD